jgi:hypothetical protein
VTLAAARRFLGKLEMTTGWGVSTVLKVALACSRDDEGRRVLGNERSLRFGRDDGGVTGLGGAEAVGFGGDAVELAVGVVAAEGCEGGAAALDTAFHQGDR